MRKLLLALLAGAIAAAPSLRAVETRNWVQEEQADFDKGTLKKLSLRSDGRLMLAPLMRQLYDASTAYLWTVAVDSKGTLYTGGGGYGGSKAKLFAVTPSGQARTFAELEGLEIHAVAVDRQDRVYAATSPDSKIYRIGADGKAALFYDPKAKYVWGMAFDSKGNLFVATGDQGEVHRVTPGGQGSVFFRTDETHARSLAIDANDNLIVGTEPSGLILRINPNGEGFVLHQAAKREVTAVAVAKDGTIYAAAVGNKLAASPATSPSTIPITTPASGNATTAGVPATPPAARTAPPTASGLVVGGTGVPGGSEVYRIERDGYVRKLWGSATEVAYALAFDPQGHALIGTGNRGNIYRIDTDVLSTLLLSAVPTQVTAFAMGRRGEVYAVTGNIGQVFEIGPGLEKQGTFDSEVFDAGSFTYWGRLAFKLDPARGSVAFATRSGNLDRPQKNWSPWAPVAIQGDGGRVTSPPARFLQYRATLTAAADGASPELTQVDVAYLAKNVAPTVTAIEVAPPNFRFPAPILTATPTHTLSLPAVGATRRTPSGSSVSLDTGDTLQFAKGYRSARWAATDPNGDELQYTLEIRGEKETTFHLLKDKLRDRHYSWDSTAFPDGQYRVRVTASDLPSNPPADALSCSLESDPFVIDNTPPVISALTGAANGNQITVRWHAKDALSALAKAEYSINGEDWLVVEPTTRLSDSREHDYVLTLPRTGSGEQTIAVRVTDEADNQAVDKVILR